MRTLGNKKTSQSVRESRMALVKKLGPLSQQEMVRYQALKKDLINHLEILSASYVKVGSILRTIRDQRLYRQEFDTFEDFCREVIGHGRRYINRVIQAHDLVQSMLEAGAEADELPPNESVARVLAEYPADMQRQIARRARELAIKAGKTQPDTLSFREAAVQLMGSQEVKTKQADELVKKAEGVARAMRVAVDFSQFDEPQYQRFMSALIQIAELTSNLLKSAQGATPGSRKAEVAEPAPEPEASPEVAASAPDGLSEEKKQRMLSHWDAPAKPAKPKASARPAQPDKIKALELKIGGIIFGPR